ncbi:hypothetical protein G9A89_010659 [Geosiphon pyriformis]|nr:hypothetical protein G9A89_010659 [Geosiphon pyriformis]
MNDTTPRKTCTHMYMLGSPPKQPSFNLVNFDNNVLELSPYVDFRSNQYILIKSCVLETRSFNSTKSFMLDIDLSAVPGKTNVNKLVCVKNFFYRIDGFGGALTPSKFPEVIRLTFTSESSLNKTRLLAFSKNILVNNDLKKINSHIDQKIIIKEIPVNFSKLAIKAVFSKFGKIISIKMQLIGLWQKAVIEFESVEIVCLVASKWSVLVRKNSVHVVLVVNDKESWISKDCYHALLYTLPVGMTAHDLSDLVEAYDRKTCVIGCDFISYTHVQCVVICFESKVAKLAAIDLVLVFKSVNLHWAGLCLVRCTKCGQFGHVTAICPVGENFGVHEK